MSVSSKEAGRAAFLEFLRKARAGSSKYLGRLLMLFEKPLLAYAYEHNPEELRSRAGGSDLFQETMAAACHHFADCTGETPEAVFHWLLAILKNTLRNHVRDQHRRKRDVGQESPLEDTLSGNEPSPQEAAATSEQEELVHHSLAALDVEDRELLRLRFFQELSYQDIGSSQGCSEESARKRCQEALYLLRAHLTPQAGELEDPTALTSADLRP